jgi:dihydroorotase
MENIHFCHITTAEAVEMIHNSKATSEVTMHHLLLSDRDTDFRVNPPLRNGRDRAKLVKCLDKIDVIASDHAPHTLEEKEEGLPGFPSVETMYPMMFYMIKKGYMNIRKVVEKFVVNPAKIFGFERYGGIEVGNYANLVVFDPKDVSQIKGEKLHTKVKWSIYEGFNVVFPKSVFIRGVKVLEDGEVLIDKGFGKTFEV